MAVLMSKTIDLIGFNGYDYEMNSITAQKVNVIQSMIVNDARNNVKLGSDAGLFLTTGYNNITIGNSAGKYLTTGHDNFVAGTNAGYELNESYQNCIVGMEASHELSTGMRNCVYGYQAFHNAIDMYDSITIGTNSAYGVVHGFNVISIGTDALLNPAGTESASDCIFMGSRAGYSGGGGKASEGIVGENIGIGVESLYSLTNGRYNVCLGKYSARGLPRGDTNCVCGYKAGSDMGESAFIGLLPMLPARADYTTGNCCYGYRAGALLRGPMNICVGVESGFSDPDLPLGLTAAAANILIGYQGPFYRTDTSNPGILNTATGNLVIGNMLSAIPPIICGTMPHESLSIDYPRQTACLHFNCLNDDYATTGSIGEIVSSGLVAEVRAPIVVLGVNTTLTATQLRSCLIRAQIAGVPPAPPVATITFTLPSYVDIKAMFSNPFSYDPWPLSGTSFYVYFSNAAANSLIITTAEPTVVVIESTSTIPYMQSGVLRLTFVDLPAPFASVKLICSILASY